MDSNAIHYGEHIHRLRRERGMSINDLAVALHVSPSLISNIERETRSLGFELACRMADIFEVPLDELAGRRYISPPNRAERIGRMLELLVDEVIAHNDDDQREETHHVQGSDR